MPIEYQLILTIKNNDLISVHETIKSNDLVQLISMLMMLIVRIQHELHEAELLEQKFKLMGIDDDIPF